MEDINNISGYSNSNYERDLHIVPDCVEKNENEVPVKQYYVAKLRNRIFGITTSQALGKIQVTNQRVLFRAAGYSPKGKNVIQQEFDINQISGFEARNERKFSLVDLFGALLLTAVGFFLVRILLSDADDWVPTVLYFIVGAASVYLAWSRTKHKFLCVPLLGAWLEIILLMIDNSDVSFNLFYSRYSSFFGYSGGGDDGFLKFLFIVMLLAQLVVWIKLVKDIAIHENVIIYVKTASTQPALNIRRKAGKGPLTDSFDHTGYSEVLPECDFEKAVKELGAMINDIKSLGDFAIEKWSGK